MSGKIIQYFVDGNTAKGYVHFYSSNLAGLNRLFILKGAPGTGKSTLMKEIGRKWCSKGYDVEWMHSSLEPDSIGAMVIPKLKFGIADGTKPHILEPYAVGAVEEYINLGIAWNSSILFAHKNEIIKMGELIKEFRTAAFNCFKEALSIHDEWECIYIAHMNFRKADHLTKTLITNLFGETTLSKEGRVWDRFLGAATPNGPIDYIENLTSELGKDFIKGRPGTGKSTLLKKVASEASRRGIDVEIYHCGFDPESLDMIVMRELGLSIFDSTAPHEYFPESERDYIIDVYKETVLPGTDEKYEVVLKDIVTRYKLKVEQGTQLLKEAQKAHKTLKGIYSNAMNFQEVNGIMHNICSELESMEIDYLNSIE